MRDVLVCDANKKERRILNESEMSERKKTLCYEEVDVNQIE